MENQQNLYCSTTGRSGLQITLIPHDLQCHNMSSDFTCFMISCKFQYLSFCIRYQLLFVSKLLEGCTELCFKHKKKCSTQSGPNIATQIIFYSDKLMPPFTAHEITAGSKSFLAWDFGITYKPFRTTEVLKHTHNSPISL